MKAGQSLGHFRVTEKLGEGGMGEVYRARDTKLDRDVAIKVLPDELAADPERVVRFEREAKLLASLNHPNIASIYGFEKNALVLELVEGPTLAERIAQGPIPVSDSIAIAKQIAEALEAGHELGVIHRDLKPANIKVRGDGTVKVLDYGLAKALDRDSTPSSDTKLSQSPTLTREGTEVGVILGTVAYMSPEQAKGKRVDKRTDIWAFGAVMFEMLTAHPAFQGEDVPDTLARVLEREPKWSALPASVPGSVLRLLRRCLKKERSERLRDAGDARIELAEYSHDEPLAEDETNRSTWRTSVVALVSAMVGALIASKAWIAEDSSSGSLEVARVTVSATEQLPFRGGYSPVVLSPDGSRLVYVGGTSADDRQLFLRMIDEFDARALPDTTGAEAPFFSPDGEWVGFFSSERASLEKVSVRGGPPIKVCDVGTSGRGLSPSGSWSADDSIVFAASEPGPLWQVSSSGGIARPITSLERGEYAHRWPQTLPGGRSLLFTAIGVQAESMTGVGVDPREGRVVAKTYSSGARTLVMDGSTHGHYLPSGILLFVRDRSLLAVKFDRAKLAVEGSPVLALEGFRMRSGAPHVSVSRSGTLAYVPFASNVADASLMWVDREGEIEPLAGRPILSEDIDLSPSGHELVVPIDGDLWFSQVELGTLQRLSMESTREGRAIWEPDGENVTFQRADGLLVRV